MELERKSFAFSIKAKSDDGATFSGLASCFYNVDDWGDIVDKGAFSDTLPQFLTRGFIGGVNHNWSTPIGVPISAKETNEGLEAEAKISDTAAGKDCKILIADGVVKFLSIGFRTLVREYIEEQKDIDAFWAERNYTPTEEDLERCKYGVRIIKKLHLYEFSPVPVPANSACRIKGSDLGLTLEEHSHTVLTAIDEFLDRIGDVKSVRKNGKVSEDRLFDLKRLKKRLDDFINEDTVGDAPFTKSIDVARAQLMQRKASLLELGL